MNLNKSAISFLAFTCLCIGVASAQGVSTTAIVQVACGGEATSNKTPKVAVRWGSPSYNKSEYFQLWHVLCNNQPQTLSGGLTLSNKHSELEIQTEGGVETHYMMIAKIKAIHGEGDSFLQIDHAGTPDVQFNNPRITVTRSAGPNRYGEQNFRVAVPDGTQPRVKIQMSAVNPSRNGQVALRWGAPDFNNSSEFVSPNPKIWKVPSFANFGAQPIHELDFKLQEKKSEFEIQTEGGTDTSYHISMWFDFGSGIGMVPDIEITHGDSLPEVAWGGPVLFNATKGNVYGELDVKVEDDQVVDPPPLTSTLAGVNLSYVYGYSPATVTAPVAITYYGKLNPNEAAGTSGNSAFTVEGSVVPTLGDNEGAAAPASASNLQAGTWTITAAQQAGGTRSCGPVQLAANTASIVIFNPDGTCRHTP